MLALTLTSLASAKEIIEVRKAGGGSYSYYIVAYDFLRSTYYTLSGPISSDAHKILIPKGAASMMTVMGPKNASGSRNFWHKNDNMNPILEVRKVSKSVLELVRVGYGPTIMSSSSEKPFERKPPQ